MKILSERAERVTLPLRNGELETLNRRTDLPLNRETVLSLNMNMNARNHTQSGVSRPPEYAPLPPPQLKHPLQKGQKTPLPPNQRQLLACFGWNTDHPDCDIDVSAFLLDASGVVPDERWFVFYGQPSSPDGSVTIRTGSGGDREVIAVDLQKLRPSVQKIVFVLTIHEALERGLHFGMIRDAYARLLDGATQKEILSFRLEDLYANVTSMTIGELYLYQNTWRFNPVGNGVHKDLAGQCALYGVRTN